MVRVGGEMIFSKIIVLFYSENLHNKSPINAMVISKSHLSLSAFLNIFISLQYFCLLRIETTTEQPAFNASLSHLVSIQLLKMSYFRTRNYQQKFGKLFRNRKLLQNKQIKIILQKKHMEKDTRTMDVIL